MAGSPFNDSKGNNKLPRLPQVHSPLPKLPALGKKEAASNIPALSPKATQLPEPSLPDLDAESGATEAIAQPSPEAIEKALAEMRVQQTAGSSPVSNISSIPSAVSSIPSDENAQKSKEADPFAGINAQPNPFAGINAQPDPFANVDAQPDPFANVDAQPAPASQPEDNAPIFGGAAAENNGDELQYEEESPDDAGEKTQMISEMPDDLELDEESQKTQINMSAMDYDPLSGKLIVESGKTSQREYILVRDKTTIGRVNKNDIAISSDIAISRHHADIDKFREGFRIRDNESANGTLLNGYRIRVGQLRNGDIIEIGSIRFRFEQSGGDPDELWKGAPKVEYHPNQKNTSMNHGAPPSVSAPAEDPRPSIPAGPQPQQMEPMLERQGGGLAAPQWPGASPMTSPYMMSYAPNLRDVNTTPLWSILLLCALGVFALGSLAYLIFVFMNSNDNETRKATIAAIEEEISLSAKALSDNRYDDAQKYLESAKAKDPDNALFKDKNFLERYNTLIIRERDIDLEIDNRRTARNLTAPLDKQREAIQYLNTVNQGSVSYKAAMQFRDNIEKNSIANIQKHAKSAIRDKNFSDARDLIAELAAIPNTESDVKSLVQLLSAAEMTNK